MFAKVAFAIWTFPSFNQTLKISRVSADLSEFGDSDFSSFIPNTSGAECCLVYFGHFYIVGFSGRVCKLLDLKDVFVAWIKIIKGLINLHA